MISFVLVPAAVGMAVLRVPLVRIVFERGAFDSAATQATAWALLFLSPAVALFTLRDMTIRAFYALQDTTSPMMVSVFAAGINIVFNLMLTPVGPRRACLCQYLVKCFQGSSAALAPQEEACLNKFANSGDTGRQGYFELFMASAGCSRHYGSRSLVYPWCT